jgi:hypothetical protein
LITPLFSKLLRFYRLAFFGCARHKLKGPAIKNFPRTSEAFSISGHHPRWPLLVSFLAIRFCETKYLTPTIFGSLNLPLTQGAGGQKFSSFLRSFSPSGHHPR